MHKYEIEIKSLLGSKDKADELINKMKAMDASLQQAGSHSQLNHYFVPTTGNLKTLFDATNKFLSDSEKKALEDLATRSKDFSVRTREADGKIIFVIKASVDDTTSSNGTARLEFEATVSPFSPGEERMSEGQERSKVKSINELDALIISAGFKYQAKWSRQRKEFIFHQDSRKINVSIDKNAGYGHLVEFELIVDDQSKAEETKAILRSIMKNLNVEELPQDRLARMFDHYNKNWEKYYGTENIFTVE